MVVINKKGRPDKQLGRPQSRLRWSNGPPAAGLAADYHNDDNHDDDDDDDEDDDDDSDTSGKAEHTVEGSRA